jgi:hypothetical protein
MTWKYHLPTVLHQTFYGRQVGDNSGMIRYGIIPIERALKSTRTKTFSPSNIRLLLLLFFAEQSPIAVLKSVAHTGEKFSAINP